MSNEGPLSFSEWVAKRVRAVRRARGWSVKDLAERCKQAGCPELTEGALYVLEGPRRRSVTGEEWMALAHALEVPPLTLALPTENVDYSVTRTVTAPAADVARWLMKDRCLPARDPETKALLLPGSDEDLAQRRHEKAWLESLPYVATLQSLRQDIPELTGLAVDALQMALNNVAAAAYRQWRDEEVSRESAVVDNKGTPPEDGEN